MENSVKRVFNNFKKMDNKLKILIALGLVGILLIMLSEVVPDTRKNETVKDYSYEEYVKSLEEKTEKILSSIEGTGRCKVMITLKYSNESVYAKNSDESSSESSFSKSSEYVLYDGQGGTTPLLIKENFPAVQGVAVVCEGADNTVVRENIINSISSLFGISVSKISVSKIKG